MTVVLIANPLPAFATGSDDLFGMYYDGGYVPSGTQGIQISYSISTTSISCSSSAGWASAIDSVRTNGGSPDEWWLQAGVGYKCFSYPGAAYWEISTEYWDNNGGKHDVSIANLSTSTYPSLSGTISEYYNGANWILKTYVSQNSQTYMYTFSSAQGTYVDGSGGTNDWTNIETDASQTGLSIVASFSWDLTNPEYYVSGGWMAWNYGSSGSCSLESYVAFQPYTPATNKIAVQKIANDGVNIYYYGASPPNNNGNTLTWSIASTYYLTMGVAGSGTVSPSSGNKNCDSGVSISASPGSGYLFCYWTGTGSGSYTGASNPVTVTMNAAVSETATFRTTCPMIIPGS
jgi:hypothetical protein